MCEDARSRIVKAAVYVVWVVHEAVYVCFTRAEDVAKDCLAFSVFAKLRRVFARAEARDGEEGKGLCECREWNICVSQVRESAIVPLWKVATRRLPLL